MPSASSAEAAYRDRFDLHELVCRYANCLDAGDFDGMAALFADDSAFHIDPAPEIGSPLVGGRAIADTVRKRWNLVHGSERRRHLMSNIVVQELAEDTARLFSVVTVLSVRPEAGSAVHLHGMGAYDDRCERLGGRWIFRERRLSMDRRDYFAPGWVTVK